MYGLCGPTFQISRQNLTTSRMKIAPKYLTSVPDFVTSGVTSVPSTALLHTPNFRIFVEYGEEEFLRHINSLCQNGPSSIII